METIDKNTTSFGISLAITSIVSAILVLIKESSQGILGLMKNMTGHHWITHGLADVILFILLGWLFTARGIPASGLTNGLVVTVGLSVVVAGSLLGLWFVFF